MANTYIGRFAPSPSGPLHFGSLIAALGSFLDARAHQGKWLVRIEDIDPPREMPGADKLILDCLEQHGLNWDDQVLYQSQRFAAYDAVLSKLAKQQQSYPCGCTRAMIKAAGGVYPGTCRRHPSGEAPFAIRFFNQHPVLAFHDRFSGIITPDPHFAAEDFIIHRKDGLYAYQLAVVSDDIYQGITHIVRGADLLDTSVLQLALYQALDQPAPSYLHLPVAATQTGMKLSKQNHAPALDNSRAKQNILAAMRFLGLTPPSDLSHAEIQEILAWGVKNWSIHSLPKSQEVII